MTKWFDTQLPLPACPGSVSRRASGWRAPSPISEVREAEGLGAGDPPVSAGAASHSFCCTQSPPGAGEAGVAPFATAWTTVVDVYRGAAPRLGSPRAVEWVQLDEPVSGGDRTSAELAGGTTAPIDAWKRWPTDRCLFSVHYRVLRRSRRSPAPILAQPHRGGRARPRPRPGGSSRRPDRSSTRQEEIERGCGGRAAPSGGSDMNEALGSSFVRMRNRRADVVREYVVPPLARPHDLAL
jgi:hypothetical protein